MVDTDLPDPKDERPITPKSREGRLFTVLFSLSLFAIAYSSIHKLWIPVFLKFTTVTQATYQEIDHWIFPAFIFGFHLWRRRRLGWLGSLLCGALIIHGALDLAFISQGKYFGWLEISHLLSSTPLALISIAWLTMAGAREPRAWAAWSGVVFGLLYTLLLSAELRTQLFGEAKKPDVVQEMQFNFNPGVPRLEGAGDCGLQAFWVNLADYENRTSRADISISNCGFSPALTRMDRFFGISIKNELRAVANIHILIFHPDGRKRGFNRILRPDESLELHRGNFNVSADEYLLIYSDTTPQAGLTALFPNDQVGLRKITRTPLLMMPIDPKTGEAKFIEATKAVGTN